jgi:hypothetical protein
MAINSVRTAKPLNQTALDISAFGAFAFTVVTATYLSKSWTHASKIFLAIEYDKRLHRTVTVLSEKHRGKLIVSPMGIIRLKWTAKKFRTGEAALIWAPRFSMEKHQ